MPEDKPIRPGIAFIRMSVNALLLLAFRVREGMTGNLRFPKPPVSMPDFSAAVDRLSQLQAATLNRDPKVTVARDQQRGIVIQMLRQFAFYAADACRYDYAGYITSGFDAVFNKFTPAQELPTPRILTIKEGRLSGELLVGFTPIKGTTMYELRYGPPGTDPETWPVKTLHRAKPATTVDGLTPGTIYAFQVRAHGKKGFTDWSGIVTRMCI